MTDAVDNVPDKAAYQVNRRRMCWVAIGMMLAVVICFLIDPKKYGGSEMAPLTRLWHVNRSRDPRLLQTETS